MAENTYTINGREVGFFYSVGARCDVSEWVIKHGGLDRVSADALVLQQAVAMNRAYNDANDVKAEPLTEKELRALPVRELMKLTEVVEKQIRADSEVSIETEEVKTKNAKSGAKK